VFGPLTKTPVLPDCSDAVVGRASTATGTWDLNRTQVDPTGFATKILGQMPLPNNYEAIGSDGLNTAGFRWSRREKNGSAGIFPTNSAGLSSPTYLSRKQINTKFDHNFNTKNKLGASYTYENSSGSASGAFESWPGGFRGGDFTHPQTLSVNFTSTLSPSLLNEVRGGIRHVGGNT
jgi:hypothetical protein